MCASHHSTLSYSCSLLLCLLTVRLHYWNGDFFPILLTSKVTSRKGSSVIGCTGSGVVIEVVTGLVGVEELTDDDVVVVVVGVVVEVESSGGRVYAVDVLPVWQLLVT